MVDGCCDVIVIEYYWFFLEILNLYNKVDFFFVVKNNYKNSFVGVIFFDFCFKLCDCFFV